VDDRSEKVNFKIREAQLQKIPYMLVIGDREEASANVAVRHRKRGDLGVQSFEDFIAGIEPQIASREVTD
jgi:threonyl-tRNA synthetase